MNYEVLYNVTESLYFNTNVPAGSSGYIDNEIKEHGFIKSLRIRFAAGENGTLHINPVMILPGNIPVPLISFAKGGNQFVNGDDETMVFGMKFETENHAILRIYYENTETDPTSTDSIVDVAAEVEYFKIIQPANIIGPAPEAKKGWF